MAIISMVEGIEGRLGISKGLPGVRSKYVHYIDAHDMQCCSGRAQRLHGGIGSAFPWPRTSSAAAGLSHTKQVKSHYCILSVVAKGPREKFSLTKYWLKSWCTFLSCNLQMYSVWSGCRTLMLFQSLYQVNAMVIYTFTVYCKCTFTALYYSKPFFSCLFC